MFICLLISACSHVAASESLMTGRRSPLHWDQCQVPVYYPEGDNRLAMTLQEAVERWNIEIGRDVFALHPRPDYWYFFLVGEPVRGSITVNRGVLPRTAYSKIHGVAAIFNSASGSISAVVITTDTHNYSNHFEYSVLVHELGHALGLTHDLDNTSIMHRTAPLGGQIAQEDAETIRDYLDSCNPI